MYRNIRLDDCIMWNAHKTVFGSKRSDICATVLVGVAKDNKLPK